MVNFSAVKAQVVEVVDTRDLKSLGHFVREGSSPSLGTYYMRGVL